MTDFHLGFLFGVATCVLLRVLWGMWRAVC